MEPEEIVKALQELAEQIEHLRDRGGLYADSALTNIYDAISDVKDFD